MNNYRTVPFSYSKPRRLLPKAGLGACSRTRLAPSYTSSAGRQRTHPTAGSDVVYTLIFEHYISNITTLLSNSSQASTHHYLHEQYGAPRLHLPCALPPHHRLHFRPRILQRVPHPAVLEAVGAARRCGALRYADDGFAGGVSVSDYDGVEG